MSTIFSKIDTTSPRPAMVPGAWLGRIGDTLRLWRQRSAARRSLARLSPRELRDIGVSPSQAAFEARQPFWQPFASLRD